MSDSLHDILARKTFEEPKEIQIIKEFVRKRFNSQCSVIMQPQQIVIGVAGSALAGSLRLELHHLQKLCKTDKRLIIRIGG